MRGSSPHAAQVPLVALHNGKVEFSDPRTSPALAAMLDFTGSFFWGKPPQKTHTNVYAGAMFGSTLARKVLWPAPQIETAPKTTEIREWRNRRYLNSAALGSQ